MNLDKNELFNHQLSEVQETFNLLMFNYSILLRKRLNDELTRDEYMMYDLMDMLISLKSAYDEITNNQPYPSYIVEKLQIVQNCLTPVLEHFKSKAGDK